MWEAVVYGLAIYGFVALCIQGMARFVWWRHPKMVPFHFIIRVGNAEPKIEWIYRSLVQMSRVEGRPCRITIIDCGSYDATLPIIERLAYGEDFVRIIKENKFSFPEGGGEQVVWIDCV